MKVLKTSRLSRCLTTFVLLGAIVVRANEPCDSTSNPCFANVTDYLGGKRLILPSNDLFYLTNRDESFPNAAIHSLLSKDLKFTASEQKIEPATKCALLRGPYGARLFDTTNDWVVSVKGAPTTNDLCGSTSDDSDPQVLTWQDSQDVSTQKSVEFRSPVPESIGITIGDVNGDGYDDVVVTAQDSEYRSRLAIYTAVDVSDPSKGLRLAASLRMEGGHTFPGYLPHVSRVAIGDFNGDGAKDLILAANDYRHRSSMYGYSVCPAAGFILFRDSTDPDTPPYTCKAAWEIRVPRRLESGVLEEGAFGPIRSPDDSGFTELTETPRLVSGDFTGRKNGQAELFADSELRFIDYSQNTPSGRPILYYRVFKLWRFDYQLRPIKLSENRVDWQTVYSRDEEDVISRPDFVRAARMHWTGSGSDRDQVVLVESQPPSSSLLNLFTFDDEGKLSGTYGKLGIAVHGEHIVGMDVGRFDPPDQAGSANPDFDRQVALLLTNIPLGTHLYAYSVDNSWNFKPVNTQNLGTWHYYRGYGAFDQLDGMMHSLDAQGRSVLFSSPFKFSIEDHIQPNLVLGIPPMHIDYIRDGSGNEPGILNLTVNPSSTNNTQPAFNTEFSFSSEGSTREDDSTVTDSTWSFGGSLNEKFVLGQEKQTNLTVETTIAAKGEWGKSHEEENAKYVTKTKSLTATTGFADHIYLKVSRQNFFAYPIIGKRCPATTPNCTPDQRKQQIFLISAPDKLEDLDVDSTTQEWYQPVQEPGNIFSYPWDVKQMKLTNPQLNALTEEQWRITDTSKVADKTDWATGGKQATTDGSVAKNQESINISVSGQVVTNAFSGGVAAKIDIGHSGSLQTENVGTTSLDASTGIQTNKPGFSPSVATKYFYYFSSYIFGKDPIGDSLTNPRITDPNGQPVDQQFFGPLTVAYAADPFHGASTAPWWRQAYGKPDLGLNHPSRWNWDAATKTASFNHREANPPDPKTILNDLFYHMKGLYIGQASDDPKASPMLSVATAGDVLRLQARIYNFSVADMPYGSSAHVRFYGQEYDAKTASLAGDGFLIGETNIGSIPGFNSPSNHGELPNWKLASTTFDTSSYSGKFLVFWVVVWGTDADGNLMEEQEGHGFTQDPGKLTFKQITDVPVEEYSNNVGMYDTFTPFFVLPAVKGSPATPPAPGDVRQLQANDVLVEATPVQSRMERSVITATIHNTSDGLLTSEPVVFYDGDPDNGGKVIDFQRIPYLEKDDTYALRTYLKPETSGIHNIFVRVGRKDARSSSLAIGSLIVP